MKRYYLRYKSEVIGTFTEEGDVVTYTTVSEGADKIPAGLGYPLGIFPLDRSQNGLKPLKEHTPTRENIDVWLGERVFPPNRHGADALLYGLGLHAYNMWEIAKRTNAVSFNDYYWMSASLADKYEDVSPRYKAENG